MKRNCICCLLSATMIAVTCCISAASVSAEKPLISAALSEEQEPAVTQPVDWSKVDPAVTQPVSTVVADPKALYGLKAEPSEVSLNVGEKQKLKFTWDGDVYRTDNIRYEIDRREQEIASVSKNGLIEALSEGTATVTVYASLDSKKITLGPSDYGTRTVEVKVTVTDPALSDSQRAALQKLKTIEQYRTYLRERAVIRGQIAPDAPRFTMDEVNKLIEESASFSELYDKIRAAQKYPDVYEDIEQTYADYWFNNRGTEGIAVLPYLERVYYFRLDDDGYCHEGGGMIYPERDELSKLEKPELDRNFRDFNETYGGTYTPAPQEQLYGLTLELPSDTLHPGEVCQLLASWNEDCYLEHPVIQSNNNDIALVFHEGLLFARDPERTTVWVKAKLNPEKVTLAEGDDGVRTVRRTITVTDKTDLTDVQKAALEPISQKELYGDRFPRAKAVIKGFLAADAPRLTPDAVSQMLEASDNVNVFMKKLTDAQPYPDWYGGSGITRCEYWLDDKGTEKISVDIGNYPDRVWYSKLRTDGSIQTSQELYPAKQEPVTYADGQSFDPVYRLFNDDTGTPKPGDVNCDGSCDVADAVLVARFAVADQDAVITDQGKVNADVVHDGNVDGEDAVKILQYIAKKISYEEFAAGIDPYIVPIDFSVAGLGVPPEKP